MEPLTPERIGQYIAYLERQMQLQITAHQNAIAAAQELLAAAKGERPLPNEVVATVQEEPHEPIND